jgi:hypothetical protein
MTNSKTWVNVVVKFGALNDVDYNIVTFMSEYRWGLDWRLDLLTTYTHNL